MKKFPSRTAGLHLMIQMEAKGAVTVAVAAVVEMVPVAMDAVVEAALNQIKTSIKGDGRENFLIHIC